MDQTRKKLKKLFFWIPPPVFFPFSPFSALPPLARPSFLQAAKRFGSGRALEVA